jgi:hypothetical protein
VRNFNDRISVLLVSYMQHRTASDFNRSSAVGGGGGWYSRIVWNTAFKDSATCVYPKRDKFLYIFKYPFLNTGCFKKSFTTLKAYRNLYRRHTQSFELSKCSKTRRVLPRIVIRNCFDLFFRFLLHGTSTVTPTPKSNGPYHSHNNEHYAHD